MLTQTLLIGLGGFVGANARYWVGGWIIQRLGPEFPYHTLVINVSGSFVLGLFMALSQQHMWDRRLHWGFAIGFLGAYTTFSTYEYESLNLLMQRAYLLSLANLLGSVAVGLVAAWAGMVAGRAMTGGV